MDFFPRVQARAPLGAFRDGGGLGHGAERCGVAVDEVGVVGNIVDDDHAAFFQRVDPGLVHGSVALNQAKLFARDGGGGGEGSALRFGRGGVDRAGVKVNESRRRGLNGFPGDQQS